MVTREIFWPCDRIPVPGELTDSPGYGTGRGPTAREEGEDSRYGNLTKRGCPEEHLIKSEQLIFFEQQNSKIESCPTTGTNNLKSNLRFPW